MLNEKTVKPILDKLFISSEFTSQINRDLLTFLVQSYFKGVIPKETTIATEILSKGKDFNPNDDPIVRVYIHNLRKKLETYYRLEGKDDEIRIELPKGRYSVQFVNRTKQSKFRFFKTASFYVILNVILIAILACYTWIHNRNLEKRYKSDQIINEKFSIWEGYLKGSLPTVIVLGGNLFFSEYSEDEKRWRYIRDLYINTGDELDGYRQKYREKKIRDTYESYFPVQSIWGLPFILNTLNAVQQQTSLRRLVEITPEVFNKNNTIFMGSIKTLGLFEQYMKSSHLKYRIDPEEVYSISLDSSKVDTFKTYWNESTQYHRDLAIALKFPGPVKNDVFIIASFMSSGVPEVVKYLTNPSTLDDLNKEFIKRYQKIPNHFEILFEVRGIVKTGFYIEIRYLNVIADDMNVW